MIAPGIVLVFLLFCQNLFQAKKYWPNWGYEDCKKLYEESLKQIDENK